MAEIGDDHDIDFADELVDRDVDLLLHLGRHRIVVDIINFEQLAHVGGIDEPSLARRRGSRTHDVVQADIWQQLLAHCLLKALPCTETGDDIDLCAKRSHVVCRRKNAACKHLVVLVACRDDILFRRFADRQHILVFVDDRVTDDKHAIVAYPVEQPQYLAQAPVAAQRAQMFANVRLEHVEMAIDQLARAEGCLVGKGEVPAMLLDGIALGRDLAGDVARRVLIILALDVDYRLYRRDRTHRVRRRVDRDPIDIFERGQHLCPQPFVEHRPSRSLVDKSVGGDRHDQHVAQASGRFEMAHMPEVQEVEGAVRLDYGPAAVAQMTRDPAELVDRAYLVTRAFDLREVESARPDTDFGFARHRPRFASLAPRCRNQSLVASAIPSTVHTGASRQYSMLSIMIRTPSAKLTSGFQPSSVLILVISAQVQSGSPGRLAMWTVAGAPSSRTSSLMLAGSPLPTL